MLKQFNFKTMEGKSELNDKKSIDLSDNLLKSCREDVFNLVKNAGLARREIDEAKIRSESDIRKILLGFLSVADSFMSRFEEFEAKKNGLSDETVAWVSKFSITRKKMLNTFKESGITRIDVQAGEVYNPEFHNAIEVEERSEGKDGIVLHEIYSGYMWEGKVLRPADVVIARIKK